MVEANYEFEHDYRTPEALRRQEYWSLLSGAAGQLYGNKYTWQFIDDWKTHLDTKGVSELQIATKLFAGRPWFKLVPDQNHQLVTEGFGSFAASGSVNDNDYVAAALTPNRKLAIAYLPAHHLHRRPPTPQRIGQGSMVRPDNWQVQRDRGIAVRGVRHPAVHAATTERFRRLRLGTGPDGGVNR